MGRVDIDIEDAGSTIHCMRANTRHARCWTGESVVRITVGLADHRFRLGTITPGECGVILCEEVCPGEVHRLVGR